MTHHAHYRRRSQRALNLEQYAARPTATETEIQSIIMKYLQYHPAVAHAYRSNSGGGYFSNTEGGRQYYVQFGFKGQPDITGFLKDGRALYIEVKSASGRATKEQIAFLSLVNQSGGVAFIARSIDDVDKYLPKEIKQ